MNHQDQNNSFGLELAQIAWVVPDIEKAKSYFQDMLGVENFSKTVVSRVGDYAATYYGRPSQAENYLAMAYAGGVFLELIQPITGESIFKDYIEQNPVGGVQHIAYRTSIDKLDELIAQFESKGHPVVSSFDTPIAKIVMFDTRAEIGVFTEIMGITAEGAKAVQKMQEDGM